MRLHTDTEIMHIAAELVRRIKSTDPDVIAEALGIFIVPVPFARQKGVYKTILDRRYIFIKENLTPQERRVVLLHEIGHDQLHRGESGSLYRPTSDRVMEYEANLFAAEILLSNQDLVRYVKMGYDVYQIAADVGCHTDLIATKTEALRKMGYPFAELHQRPDFLSASVTV